MNEGGPSFLVCGDDVRFEVSAPDLARCFGIARGLAAPVNLLCFHLRMHESSRSQTKDSSTSGVGDGREGGSSLAARLYLEWSCEQPLSIGKTFAANPEGAGWTVAKRLMSARDQLGLSGPSLLTLSGIQPLRNPDRPGPHSSSRPTLPFRIHVIHLSTNPRKFSVWWLQSNPREQQLQAAPRSLRRFN
jgi:hypothetical protein